MTLQLGILMALACAFATNLGFLYKYRGARAAASVDIRHPVRSAGSLVGSKWFASSFLSRLFCQKKTAVWLQLVAARYFSGFAGP